MSTYRYVALEASGAASEGVIEAADRRSALQQLGERGLYPSRLELWGGEGTAGEVLKRSGGAGVGVGNWRLGSGVRRKDVAAFTREMAALLGASIPIPRALESLCEEEENGALREVVKRTAESVRKGTALSAALEEHPRLFSSLYVSMVRVGEEAGVLPKVMSDLAALLEHEDEVRGEVVAAVAYPVFVLGFGIFTVTVLLTVVLPRLFGMLEEMLPVLPLPTLVLLRISGAVQSYWIWLLLGIAGAVAAIRWYARTPAGALMLDRVKLGLPLLGRVFQAAALGRFARTLGTLVGSGVSLLPALKIVESTIGNLVLSGLVARVAEETRGGDSLAAPLRQLGVFPRTAIQMISVGEETGRLDEMLLKVADMEERHMRARTRVLIALLGPALILVVGAVVGFMVIALLLPIFKMSRAIH